MFKQNVVQYLKYEEGVPLFFLFSKIFILRIFVFMKIKSVQMHKKSTFNDFFKNVVFINIDSSLSLWNYLKS